MFCKGTMTTFLLFIKTVTETEKGIRLLIVINLISHEAVVILSSNICGKSGWVKLRGGSQRSILFTSTTFSEYVLPNFAACSSGNLLNSFKFFRQN